MKKFCLVLFSALITVSAFALEPKEEYDITPGDYGLTYEEIDIPTTDELTLKGWLIEPTSKSKKVVVFSHNGEGNMADYLEHASQFLSLGYNVLMYDYRGYGQSSDFNINEKFYIYSQFSQDLVSVLDWVKKYRSVFSTDLYGIGLGGALSIAVGANRPEIGYVVADGAYASLERVQSAYQKHENKKVLMPLGYDKTMMEPIFALESKGDHLKGILLINSEGDQIVTEDDAEDIKDKTKKAKIYTVESETNDQNFYTNKDAYFKEVKKFLGV